MRKINKILIAICTGMILLSPALATVSVGTMTRSFSTPNPATGEAFTVTLTPGGVTTRGFYQVIETLPVGFTFVSSTANNSAQTGQVITFTRLDGTPFPYTVTAPTITGPATFTGTFIDDNRDTGDITGQSNVNVRGTVPAPVRVLDEKVQGTLGPYTWNAQNFQGFWYDLDEDVSSETLELRQVGLNSNSRTIEDQDNLPPTGGLVYRTQRMAIPFEINSYDPILKVENGLDANLVKVPGVAGTHYAKIGWMAEEFVAVNGNTKKLSKLLIEQEYAASEKKILTEGESWRIGDWTLTANSIDARASPRQVWIVLSWKGQEVDNKVIGQGEVYTYTERYVVGESDVPMFVTFIDSVFAGATTDMAQLRFTWAINRDVEEVMSGDKIGVFEFDTTIDRLTGRLDSSIDLSPASTTILARNLVIKVADDADFLRFMPDTIKTPVYCVNYDLNGNNRIDKYEAIKAVTDFFAGTVTSAQC